MLKNLANIITGLRLLLALALLLLEPFAPAFWAVYLLCGVSDMLDGPVARRTKAESAFGAKLDSIADLVLVAVVLWKLLPFFSMERWLCVWIVLIALLKLINFASGLFLSGKLVMLHTLANKVTGLLLFLIPPFLVFWDIRLVAIPACLAATFAAIEEGHLIRKGRRE